MINKNLQLVINSMHNSNNNNKKRNQSWCKKVQIQQKVCKLLHKKWQQLILKNLCQNHQLRLKHLQILILAIFLKLLLQQILQLKIQQTINKMCKTILIIKQWIIQNQLKLL